MTTKLTKIKLATLAGAALVPIQAEAAVLANFDFTGPPWTAQKENVFATFAANAPSSDADANSLTSTLSNSGHTGGGYASYYIRDIDGGTVGVADANDFVIFSATDTPGVGMNVGNSNATSPTNYVSFTVTPDAGFETTYESISLYTGANGAADQYNVDIRAWDGTTETTLGLVNRTTPAGTANQPIVQDTFDFADFTSTAVTEFRFYSYNVTGGGAAGGVRFDDIVLNGVTAPVPEPSATAFLGLAALTLLRRRRK